MLGDEPQELWEGRSSSAAGKADAAFDTERDAPSENAIGAHDERARTDPGGLCDPDAVSDPDAFVAVAVARQSKMITMEQYVALGAALWCTERIPRRS